MYNGEDITEHNNQRKLNILKGFVEVTDIIEKGHMDFGGGKAPAGGKGNLVQKKITDKSGHNTTRWVKNGQEETGQDESNVEAEQSTEGVKTSDDHAKETQSEDLKTYIANNPDGEHVAAAQAELQTRGESEGMDNSVDQMGTAQDDFSGVSDEELYDSIEYLVSSDGDASNALAEFKKRGGVVEDWMMSDEDSASYEEGEGFSGSEGGVNYDDPNSVSQAISENRDAILDLLTSDPSLNAITALKLHMANSGSNTEAHGALDAAQQALDAAKSATGHPGSTSGDGQSPIDNDEEEGNFDPEISAQNLSADMANAVTQEFGEGLSEDKSLHVEDLRGLLDDYNFQFMGESIDSNNISDVKIALEKQGWTFEGDLGNEDDDEDGTENYDKEVSEGGGGDSNFHNQDEEEDEGKGGGDSNFHKQDEDKNSDNSQGFGGGDTESEDDGSGKDQDEKEKKKPNFGKK